MKAHTIVVAYDGTQYHGWQEQKNERTIAGTLQSSFKKIFGHEIKTVGASRTDAGVHALGQVARFYTDINIDSSIMLRSWNGALPKDIQIRSLRVTEPGFHPQHNVKEKVYQYHFFIYRPLPFVAQYGHYVSHHVDIEKLEQALQCFVGTHDFTCFSRGSHAESICTIKTIKLEYIRQLRIYRITFVGKRFLYNMIRRMVGAALKISSSDEYTKNDILHALEYQELLKQLPNAPACGLLLRKIFYNLMK